MKRPERFPPDDPREWLNHARSNLAMAKNRVPEVYLEDLCFEAQQAAEKAIKAVMIMRNIEFPKRVWLEREGGPATLFIIRTYRVRTTNTIPLLQSSFTSQQSFRLSICDNNRSTLASCPSGQLFCGSMSSIT